MKHSVMLMGLSLALACIGPRALAQATPDQPPEPQRQDLAAKVPAGMPVHVENPYGSVFLRFGGYENAVDIHSTLQQPAGAPALTLNRRREKGRYLISATLPPGAVLASDQRIDLAVYVAKGHPVSASTDHGDIESRGLKSDLDLRTAAGNIAVRGTDGTVQAQTGPGRIEVTFAGPARAGSTQRLSTTTGNITIGATDGLNAKVDIATSAAIATDYSLDVIHRDGEEPNKWAQTVIGAPAAEIKLESRQGEIRLLRRAVYVEVGERPPQ